MQRSLKSETVESIVDDGSQNKKVNSVQWDSEKVNVDSEANQDGDNITNEQSNERLSVMRQQFAVAASGTGSSSIEDRVCCTNMALKVYKKAWEGARKALPRATRNRITSSDNNSSVEQRHAIGNQDPTISIESEDDPATECSFEYDEDGDLRSEVGDPLKRRGKDADRPTTLRGLERLSTDTEEFGEDETASGPEDVDLESFKRVYMSDLVIPEEPDKETAAFQETKQLNSELEKNNNQEDSTIKSEGSKWKRRFKLDEKLDSNPDNSTTIVEENNNSKGGEATIDENIGDQTTGSNENKQTMNEPDKPMSLTDIERFVQVTCDQVMEKVRGDINDADDLSVRGSGIFKIRPGLRNENSTDSRASTDITISTIEIPTITITEDQLDDSSVILSEATLRDGTGSEGDELPEDGNSAQGTLKGRASSLKFKVRRFGSKVKDIFKRSTTPEVSPAPSPVGEYIDIEEEKRRRKEEEKEAEKKRKMEEIARKEEEKRRKDEAEKKRRDDELEREYERMVYEMEKKAELEAAKEIERRKKKEEKRMKEEEERMRKEEEKARKEEEKRRKAEEEKKRRDEEMEREYERMVYEMEKKAELEAAKERERQKKRDEKRRKEEERIRKMKEEEEQRRLKGEEEERRKIRENEEKRRKQAEEEERRIRQLEGEEERRRKRQEEEKEQKRLIKEESANLRETLKRKLEEGLLTGGGKDGDDGDIIKNEAGEEENRAIKSEQDEPFYMVDGKQDSRRASSPSLVSGPASVTMSKSTSLATIMVTSPASNRDKRSPSRGEETFGQTGESEGDVDPQMDGRKRKKMKKRLRDTKNKLINLKSKALESFPSISTLKSRVKEILPVRSGASGPDESGQGEIDRRYSIHREQKIFSEYRKRYPDSENEFFSDSELVESRKSTLKAISPDLEQVPGGMYDEIEISTEDRVQLLLSPINSPLRPPRRSNYGANSSFHASEPNISRTGTPKKPKRAPPPRPPPPEVDVYLLSSSGLDLSREGSTATSLGALEDIDLNSSNRDLTTPTLVRNESDRIPASIYYRNVVRDWQERHNKRIDELISASSPNLEVYQRPPRSGRPPPRIPPHPISGTHSRPQPLPRRRESRGSILRQKIRQQQAEEAAISKENIDGYEVLEKRDSHPLTASSGLPPLPPPRYRSDRHTPMSKSPYSTLHRLQQQKQQQRQQQNRLIQQDYLLSVDRANLATDGLYWKPFSWKTGRCRSLTELYVRKRSQPPIIIDCKPSESGSDHSLNQEPVEKSLSYRLMSQYCSPPRPPPPTITTDPPPEDLKDRLADTEPIYSTIDRSKKLKRDLENMPVLVGEIIQSRPLPAPPLPPRSKRKNSLSRSRSNSPYLSLAGSSVDLNRPEATFIRPVSPYPIVGMVDVSVETGSQLIDYPRSLESKGCQTSLEDLTSNQLKTNFTQSNDQTLRQLKDMKESYVHLDCTEEVGYTDDGRESITPTPTTVAQIAIAVTSERELNVDGYKNNDLNLSQLKRTRLSSSSSKESSPPLVTASSGSLNIRPANDEASSKTITHYYDAEECDTDMDTFADLDSLSTEATQTLTASSQFHSVLSEPQTISSSITGAVSHYDTDQASSKTMEIPTPPEDPAPQPPTAESTISGDMMNELASSSSRTIPLIAEHVTIDEDSDDDMLQPRVASPSEMRAYMSRRRMRPDSMDASDSEW